MSSGGREEGSRARLSLLFRMWRAGKKYIARNKSGGPSILWESRFRSRSHNIGSANWRYDARCARCARPACGVSTRDRRVRALGSMVYAKILFRRYTV